MGNHAYASVLGCEPDFVWDAFVEALRDAANRRFGDAASVRCDDEGEVTVILVDPDSGKTAAPAEFWLREMGTVEWRHTQSSLEWWLAGVLSASAIRGAARVLGGQAVVTDDADELETEPDFDIRYPRFSDWSGMPLENMRRSGRTALVLIADIIAGIQASPGNRGRGLTDLVNRVPPESSGTSGARPGP